MHGSRGAGGGEGGGEEGGRLGGCVGGGREGDGGVVCLSPFSTGRVLLMAMSILETFYLFTTLNGAMTFFAIFFLFLIEYLTWPFLR